MFGSFINFRVPESGNRLIIVPGADAPKDLLRQRAKLLEATLEPYDVPIRRFARMIIDARDRKPDWRTDARVLTDQYSPANLLQSR